MNKIIVTFLFLFLTFTWRQIAPKDVRDKVMPWVFACMIAYITCSTFMPGIFHALMGLTNYIFFAITCNGFDSGQRNKNDAWGMFMVFWGYMVVSAFWGLDSINAFFVWMNVCFTTFCCGYYVALWVLKTEGGLRKLLAPIVGVAGITVLAYYRHGGMIQLDVGMERGIVDLDTLAEGTRVNENGIAVHMILLLTFLSVAILRIRTAGKDKIIKMVAAVISIPVAILMIRTGSRGGTICLLPIILYFLYSQRHRVKKVTQIATIIMILIAIAFGTRIVMKDADVLRAFSLNTSSSQSGVYASNVDQITTGRFSMWERVVHDMTAGEMLAGQGLFTYDLTTGRAIIGNAHSMYMTVFYNSGFIGIILMLSALVLFIRQGFRLGDRGRLGLLFIGVWLMHGIGESWGMTGGGTAILAGFGMGLLSHCQVSNSEFYEMPLAVPGFGAYRWS